MVSHHLQILHRATLATRTKHGSRVYHQINDYALEVVARDPTSPQGLAGPSRSPSAYENPADLQQRPPLAGSSPWTVAIGTSFYADVVKLGRCIEYTARRMFLHRA